MDGSVTGGEFRRCPAFGSGRRPETRTARAVDLGDRGEPARGRHPRPALAGRDVGRGDQRSGSSRARSYLSTAASTASATGRRASSPRTWPRYSPVDPTPCSPAEPRRISTDSLRGSPPPPEVLSPTQRNVPGVLTKRCRASTPATAPCSGGIPVTTVPRTLVDLAAVLPEHQLALAVHEASVRFDLTPDHVRAARLRGRRDAAPGPPRRRPRHAEQARTPLPPPARRRPASPCPQTNRLAGGRRVDCRWPEHRLTVELDGYRYHRSRHAWEQDRRREREAYARGDGFRRYTYADVVEDPRLMLRELRAPTGPRRLGEELAQERRRLGLEHAVVDHSGDG